MTKAELKYCVARTEFCNKYERTILPKNDKSRIEILCSKERVSRCSRLVSPPIRISYYGVG